MRLSDRHYLPLSSLSDCLQGTIASELAHRSSLRLLDVGCGCKPYLPYFSQCVSEHIGIDVVPGEHVDDIGVAENLPYPDESFDIVLCTQVLEHSEDPHAAAREMFRVLRPGGLALISTHGVFLYHPDPPESDRDYGAGLMPGFEGFSARRGAGRRSTYDRTGMSSRALATSPANTSTRASPAFQQYVASSSSTSFSFLPCSSTSSYCWTGIAASRSVSSVTSAD